MKGTCLRWTGAFGFIKPDEPGARDVFCHHTAIQCEGYRELRPGQHVEFEIEQDPRGPRAINVRPIGNEQPSHADGDEE